MHKLRIIRERTADSLWIVPALLVAASILLSFATVHIDRNLQGDGSSRWWFGGGPSAARDVLGAISSSMITFTAVVFSITVVTLQLASSQFSPRVLRTFLRDPYSKISLGTFVASFVYALSVLRTVRVEEEAGSTFVPHLSVTVALLLVLASVGVFVVFINHIAQSIRVVHVIERVAGETHHQLDKLLPDGFHEHEGRDGELGEASAAQDPAAAADGRHTTISAPSGGVLIGIDLDRLCAIGERHDAVVEVLHPVGHYIPAGYPVVRWRAVSPPSDTCANAVRQALALSPDRTMVQDPGFGIRQLVDVAVRALSPGTNDPTTAVQALDRIHGILRTMACRAMPDPVRRDSDGRPRVRFIVHGWAHYLALGCDELRLYGTSSTAVVRRMRLMLEDLEQVAPEARRPPIREQLQRLEQGMLHELPPHEHAATR